MSSPTSAVVLLLLLLAGFCQASGIRVHASATRRHSNHTARAASGAGACTCDPEAVARAERLFWPNESVGIGHALLTLLEIHPTGTWLQIGSNSLDPDSRWQARIDPTLFVLPKFAGYRHVFVEPIPSVFEALQANVRKLGLGDAQLVNAAILPEAGPESRVDMFCAPLSMWEGNFQGGCSFSEAKVQAEIGAEAPRKLQVRAIDVATLLSRHSIEGVRFLMLDAEGYDDSILYQFPFGHPDFAPSLVLLEVMHFRGERLERVLEFLRRRCYLTSLVEDNLIAARLPV